jgi:hypothetical protein
MVASGLRFSIGEGTDARCCDAPLLTRAAATRRLLQGITSDAAEALAGGPGAAAVGLQTVLTVCALAPSLGVLALTPSTFLAYNWGTSVEELRRDYVVDRISAEQRTERCALLVLVVDVVVV